MTAEIDPSELMSELKSKLMKKLKKRKIKYIKISNDQTLDLVCNLFLNNKYHDCNEPIYLLYAALYNIRITKKYNEAEKYLLQIVEEEDVIIKNRALEELGNIFFKRKKYYLAEKYFLTVLNNKPNSRTRLNLIIVYLHQKRIDLINKHLPKFNAENSSNGILIKVAYICKKINQINSERKYLLMSYRKGNKYVSHKLSLNYVSAHDYPLAEKYAKITLSIYGKSKEAFSILILSLITQEKFDEAERYCLEKLENWKFHSLFFLALVYQNQKKYDLAESYYLKAIEKGSINSMRNLSRMYSDIYPFASMFRKNGSDSKVVYLSRPKYAGYYFESKYGEQELSNRIDKYALMACEQGCKQSMVFMADRYKKFEKYDLASEYYLKAVDSGFDSALGSIAMMHARRNEDHLVEKYCSIIISKKNVYLISPLIRYYRKKQKNDMIEKIFSLVKNYYLVEVKKNPRIFKFLADFYNDFNKPDLAIKFYLLAYEHGVSDALIKIAQMYSRHHRYDLAEEYYIMIADKYYYKNRKKKYVNAIKNLIDLYKKYKCNEFIEEFYLSSIENVETENSKELMYDLAFLYEKQNKLTLSYKYYAMAAKYYHKFSIIKINDILMGRFDLEKIIDISNILSDSNHHVMNDAISFIENNKDISH